jgi:hypothetical protein
MDFDDQIRRYFGADDLGDVEPSALGAGIERITVDLGLERDPNRRFALWALLYMLGHAPDLEATFPGASERDAARRFMDLSDAAAGPDD